MAHWFFASKVGPRLPDSPLADPGVRYSLTGLVKRARTQKDWGNHRGNSAAAMIPGFRFAVNAPATSAQPRHRYSNPECCFWNTDLKTSVVTRVY
jgi:hypothetical protein